MSKLILEVNVNISNTLKGLGKTVKQLNRVNAMALNNTAFEIRKSDVPKGFEKSLDRPTPFTKRGVRVKKARSRAAFVMAWIHMAPIQDKYLSKQVFGGVSTEKHPVPSRTIKLNKYGNLTRRATKRKGTFNVRKGNKSFTMIRSGKRTVKMVALWPTSRRYRKRLPFDRIVYRGAKRVFNKHYRAAFKRVLK